MQPRESQNGGETGEEVPSTSALNAALAEVDLETLVAVRAIVVDLQQSLARIEALVGERSAQPGALRFDRLGPLVGDIAGFLDRAVAQRDPALGLAAVAPDETSAAKTDDAEPDAPAGSAPAIHSTSQAQAALAAAAAYFAQSEPSSPILLLIGQAQALVGRSFYEAMQVLLPEESPKARLRVGQEPAFVLLLERLASLPVVTATQGGDKIVTDIVDNETAADDASILPASDRRKAMILLQQVAAHFRRAEPSSPIPLLLDRAEGIAGKDFFGLLREAFPAGSLKVDEQPG